MSPAVLSFWFHGAHLSSAKRAAVTTADDLYAWDQALTGEKLLSADAKKALFSPGQAGYACGWFVQTAPALTSGG